MFPKNAWKKGGYTLQKIFHRTENFPQTACAVEKIVLRMRSAENFPFRGEFSVVYMHPNERVLTTDSHST